jgi:hypothetical protein
MESMRSLLHGGIKNPTTGMVESDDVPYHIMLRHDNMLLQEKCKAIEKLIDEKDQQIRGMLTQALEKYENRVVNKLINNLDIIKGAVGGVTQLDLVQSIRTLQNEIVAVVNSEVARINSDRNNYLNVEEDNNNVHNNGIEGSFEWDSFEYNGSPLNPVPANFQLSSRCNASNWFNLWFFGDYNTKIRPYYMIAGDQIPIKKDRHKFSKGKVVMEYFSQSILSNFGGQVNHGHHITDDVRRIRNKLIIH